MSAADDLKRLAEAYLLVDEWLGGADDLNEVPSEIAEFIDLAAQLYADNRALNERIGEARSLIAYLQKRIPRGYLFDVEEGASLDWEDRINLWLSPDDAAQHKG